MDFFNQVNLLYGTLTEFCTNENCPTMTAGPKYGIILKHVFFFVFSSSFMTFRVCLGSTYFVETKNFFVKSIVDKGEN